MWKRMTEEEFPVTNLVYFNNQDVVNEYIKKVEEVSKRRRLSLEISCI